MRTARLVAATLVVLSVVPLLGGAATAGAPPEPPEGRLLIFSIPGISWADLTPETAPALSAFLDGASVANLATRVTDTSAAMGESYLTVGSGTRAVDRDGAASLAFNVDETLIVDTAGDEYTRRSGDSAGDAAVVLITMAELQDVNDSSPFGAELGTIGQALAESGRTRGVIANADRPPVALPSDADPFAVDRDEEVEDPEPVADPEAPEAPEIAPAWELHREAAAALVDEAGLIPTGRVDHDLLMDDPLAAFGVRLDPAEVDAAFDDAWAEDGAVVLVEGSDLPRAYAATNPAVPEAGDTLEGRALGWSDDVFAQVLAHVDLTRDNVMVVAPGTTDIAHLNVFGVGGPGYEPGLLESAQTRQPGFVTITDVGPTILDVVGLPLPGGVEGRPVTFAGSGGDAAERRDYLLQSDIDARFRDDNVRNLTRTFVLLQMLFVVLVALAVATGRGGGPVRLGGLWLVALLPLTYLAALADFPDYGLSAYLGFVVVGAALLVVIAWAAGRRSIVAPPALLLATDLAVITVSVVLLSSELQLSTLFGDSPIVAGRFSGVNNITFSQLVVAALVLAALAVRFDRHRLEVTGRTGVQPRGGLIVAALLLGAVLVIDALPMWGADVGGVLAALPAFAVTGLALLGRRMRWRVLIGWCLAAIAAVVVLGLFDLSRPAEDRSHLGRLFERVGDDGLGGLLLVINRKLAQNLRTITDQPWTWLLITSALVLGYLLWRHRDRVLAPFVDEPELRAAGMGLAVAMLLGFALNDSGVAVPGMILAVATPCAAWIVLDPSRRGRADDDDDIDTDAPLEAPSGDDSAVADPIAGCGDATQASTAEATSGTLVTTPSTPNPAKPAI